ncbi:hypothetical protein DM01DRAFT_1336026 [Hesseltinella vesiculosa]|uniref:Uncharacterized protein n=1 Tax=Hesseltinella vesiculosa TaxID=101127 RepID=A0A1X2GGV3_9FUNG|nr:hypothetical protein DM01DRAFT_1336026 [Hesseltinella vesiculosa]
MVQEERRLKAAAQKATRDVHAAQDSLANLRRTRYHLQEATDTKKPKKTKPSPPIPPTKINKTTRVEEDPRHTQLDLDLKECILSGTDYGIVTMATTVTHTLEELEKLKAGQFFKLPKPTKLVAKDIAWKTGQFQLQRRLQRAKEKTGAGQEVSQAEAILAHNSLASAMTVQQLNDRFAQTRSKVAKLREFYHHPQIERRRRHLQWRQWLVKTKIPVDAKRKHDKTLIQAIGHAGTGVGSRVGGHFRLGGKWHRHISRQHTIVLVTNEARTSMTCPFCRHRIIHPRKTVNGRSKLNLGTSCCTNPSYSLSCTCIALRCYGQLTNCEIL